MTRRRPTGASPVLGRAAGVLAAFVAIATGSFLCLGLAPPAGAQAPVQQPVTNPALGLVTGPQDEHWLGWVGASGVVVTSIDSPDVGKEVTYTPSGSKAKYDCYVARKVPEQAITLLRCGDLDVRPLGIEKTFPSRGQNVVVVSLANGDYANTLISSPGQVTENDVSFMGSTRIRLSTHVSPVNADGVTANDLTTTNASGSVVLDEQGRVVSVVFAAPDLGGQPLGLAPRMVDKTVASAITLPRTFGSAVLNLTLRRALIPASVGLVVGIVWGAFSRNRTVLVKAISLTLVGVVGAGLYTIFLALVAGPETLLG